MAEQRFYNDVTCYFDQATAFTTHPKGLLNQVQLRAQIILEGANGPTTPEVNGIFLQHEKLVIPDVFANAGDVIVSYFEWLKNLSHVRFGRLERRHQVHSDNRLLQAMEMATGGN